MNAFSNSGTTIGRSGYSNSGITTGRNAYSNSGTISGRNAYSNSGTPTGRDAYSNIPAVSGRMRPRTFAPDRYPHGLYRHTHGSHKHGSHGHPHGSYRHGSHGHTHGSHGYGSHGHTHGSPGHVHLHHGHVHPPHGSQISGSYISDVLYRSGGYHSSSNTGSSGRSRLYNRQRGRSGFPTSKSRTNSMKQTPGTGAFTINTKFEVWEPADSSRTKVVGVKRPDIPSTNNNFKNEKVQPPFPVVSGAKQETNRETDIILPNNGHHEQTITSVVSLNYYF